MKILAVTLHTFDFKTLIVSGIIAAILLFIILHPYSALAEERQISTEEQTITETFTDVDKIQITDDTELTEPQILGEIYKLLIIITVLLGLIFGGFIGYCLFIFLK